jgi:hypothetical protein
MTRVSSACPAWPSAVTSQAHLRWSGEVELRGIEPLTSSMPWKRSTN